MINYKDSPTEKRERYINSKVIKNERNSAIYGSLKKPHLNCFK